ncbi:MAG: UDP-N-acetylmuramoyl-L-alanine--D-glutamate ligase [Candidatus Margulisiibacteriota bacterium]|jgi:UDP-N-acetylmuramoylalanine--D-glutamate ligase
MVKSESWFQNKKVLVFGLGLHGGGLAVVNWLVKHGAQVIVTDKKNKIELKSSLKFLSKKNVELYLGSEPSFSLLSSIDLIIQNPGVPNEHKFLQQAKRKKIPITNEAGLFFSLCKSKIIAITGSKGKSTTTDLLGNIAKYKAKNVFVGGNIRTNAMFSFLDKINKKSLIILELSSWQLEGLQTIKRSPAVAVVTNIQPEHLNRYKSYAGYVQAKSYICRWQKSSDHLILNYDNKEASKLSFLTKAKVYWFSLEKKISRGVFLKDNCIYWKNNKFIEKVISIDLIKLKGNHNLQNVMAAVCASKILGFSNLQIQNVLKRYKGLPDRLELIRTYKGINFINDTTATAPIATISALQTLSVKIILLAGGSSKKLPVKELARWIKNKVSFCLLFKGQGSQELVRALKEINFDENRLFSDFSDMKTIVKTAWKLAKKNDVVLLSPGFASFSNFINEFDRGEQFKKEVKLLL